jgi:poly-gamma-glutamate system protein
LGGSGDVGEEYDPTFRDDLLRRLLESDVPVLQNPDLRANVAERLAIYGFGTTGWKPVVFVNIGGAEVNLGISPRILNVPPGLVGGAIADELRGGAELIDLPPESQRGVLFELASQGVPVIHLLHVRGLVLRYGLPWDPLPLPEAGSTRLMDVQKGKDLGFWILTAGYLGALALVASFRRKKRGPETVR